MSYQTWCHTNYFSAWFVPLEIKRWIISSNYSSISWLSDTIFAWITPTIYEYAFVNFPSVYTDFTSSCIKQIWNDNEKSIPFSEPNVLRAQNFSPNFDQLTFLRHRFSSSPILMKFELNSGLFCGPIWKFNFSSCIHAPSWSQPGACVRRRPSRRRCDCSFSAATVALPGHTTTPQQANVSRKNFPLRPSADCDLMDAIFNYRSVLSSSRPERVPKAKLVGVWRTPQRTLLPVADTLINFKHSFLRSSFCVRAIAGCCAEC